MRIATFALMLFSLTAHADPTCSSLVCDDRTAHPGVYSCDTPECYCNDTCQGGANGGGQGNPAAAQAAGKVLASIFITIGFAFMPGHVAEMFAKDGEKQTGKQAQADWNAYVAKRQALVAAGRNAEKESAAYWAAYADEHAHYRDAVVSKPALKPFHPPKLVPDLHYMCDQAKLLVTTTHSEGPIGMFENEGKMVEQCKQFTEQPRDPDRTCPATTLACGLSNPDICCPTGYPIYNPCSEKCYRTTDFVAGPDEGLHCTTSRDCGATIK